MIRPALAFAACTLLSSLAFAPRDAAADVGQRLPRLARLHAELTSARGGPMAYLALRQIWQEWDRGDPAEVEETLHEVSVDAAEAAPIRAYAMLLEGYARRRRGDLEGARARLAKLGYVDRWMIVGPFENEGKIGFSAPFEPETTQTVPLSPTLDYDGKGRKRVRWRGIPAVSPFAWLDLGVFLRPNDSACAYAVTFVRDARTKERTPERTVSVWAGASGAMRVWWNNTEILRDDKYRDLDSDRFAAQVTLRSGWNRLLAKVCNAEGASGPVLSLRVAGANGGPDDHIEIDANAAHSTTQGGAVLSLGRGAPAGPGGPAAIEGSIQLFEHAIKSEAPAIVEGYARFLQLTQGDETTDRRSRELARRAADKAPTISRVLLAGELAENRNQRAIWIERAEALAKRPGTGTEDAVAVLLARAAHARGGSNWRDAVPFYERALKIDPDNVIATLARVELYQEAGLRETSLAFLEGGIARRPKSVALLRALVSTLRQQQRTTEADEAAERYAQVRFDDPTFARTHIDLAIARRDAQAANRWSERLIATNPDSAGALQSAASAYVSLGDRAKAIAMYQRALEFAPNDTLSMRELAAVYGLAGQRDEQLKRMKRILELQPNDEVRTYVAHSEPEKPKPDEIYARPSSEFLRLREAPPEGRNRRTLVDLQVTTVFPNGLANRFHQAVFQPLNDAAAAGSREFGIPYESDTSAVQIRGAKIYRTDGRVDTANETGEGGADDPSTSTYTSARIFYVRFPRINPGDVVEVLYRVEDIAPRNAFADYFGEVNYMQSNEPVARAEYVLITPKSRSFNFNHPKVPGLTQTVEESGDSRTYKFLALNVAPIEHEAGQPPPTEFFGHVHVSTYRTWEDVGRWYWGLVKDQFVPDDEVRRRAAELTKGLTDERAKVKAIYDYVVQKTRYVALEFGIHGFKPYRCAQIFARGFGDCKDKATLIVTMLKELGIPSTIVVVRSGQRGLFDEDPASLAPFDHAIAYVPSLDLYLDGTAEYTGSLELPAMDRGAMALQINEGKAKLVHLPDPPASESLTAQRVDASVAADGSAQLDWRLAVSGVEASSWRARLHAEATRRERLQQLVGSILAGAEVSQVDANNLEDIEQNVSVHAKARSRAFARKDGDSLSIPVGPREHFVRDFAPLATRKLDLRFESQWSAEQEWTVRVPGAAHVKAAPSPSSGRSPFGSYRVEVETVGTTIRVKTSLALTRLRVTAAEYRAFRAFCEEVDRALGQRVVVAFK